MYIMITILIPLYNGIEYLPETIHSVISQTYTDWKMLIGINGHGDDGGEVALQVEQLVKSEPRIQVIIQPVDINNKPKSLNNLINFVNTEWVAILDADDVWLPTKLEEQISIISSSHYEIIGTQCEYFGNREGTPAIPLGSIPRGFTLYVNPIINSSVVFKTKHAQWDESLNIYEDYDLWMKLDYNNVSIFNIGKILVKHRIHKTSFFNTKTGSIDKLKEKYIKLFNE